MAYIKFYVTLDVDDELLSDDYHSDTMCRITESVQELAEAFEGEVYDLEIK